MNLREGSGRTLEVSICSCPDLLIVKLSCGAAPLGCMFRVRNNVAKSKHCKISPSLCL